MKSINKKILFIIIILTILIVLTEIILLVKDGDNEGKSEGKKEKIYYEIKYLDEKIIYMVGILNGTNIKWKELINDIKYIYNYWNSAILDLSELENIDKNLLMEFGENLDELAIGVNNKEKIQALYYLSMLYNKLVVYYQGLNYNYLYENILNVKYNLLLANVVSYQENWTQVYEKILDADKYLLNIVNNFGVDKYSQYNINQAYIAVKELENIINIKDIDVFKLKYNIAIEKISLLYH